ncbi:MAG: dihydroneopterin aldolase [Sulfurimonas sp.]|uniref:dihydroneopterin aldolase n=1 Tax=Sulfurimonas sp. TaxID=2022749 RepID=UPI00260D477A|nr:dihydroneopterin aldolase [Sulfurimonas sp.]MDD2651584.1 dihydroneopterin aldolase [Sulfurimonas sp.]MDD3451395.1 dihydroneopterin aldolase [Sulfurimonas sp.]
MTIHIEDLKFQCIVGILDFERKMPQDVIINLTIEYDYQKDAFIDYALVVQKLKKMMIDSQFYLLEEALQEIIALLAKEYKGIKNISLKITKTSILNDCSVSVSEYISL